MESIIRSSITSVASSASSIIDDNDPITRDCQALRQHLLDTERSLQNLSLKQNKPEFDMSKITCSPESDGKESVYQSDNPPVLTLADLTPTNSQNFDFDTGDFQSEELFPRHSSFNDLEKKDCSRTSSRSHHSRCSHRSCHSHSTTTRSHHGSKDSLNSTESDADTSILRRKIVRLREENASLFVQNNKLLSELEKTTFQLQESRAQIKELNNLVEENQKLKATEFDETIKVLNEQLHNKDYAISELEALVLELRSHLRNGEDGGEYTRLKEKINELTEGYQDYVEREKKLQLSIGKLEELKNENTKKISELESNNQNLREENRDVLSDNMNIQEQLTTLKAELLTLQSKSAQADCLSVENSDLKVIVDDQQMKLSEYEIEVGKTKDHMAHLEKLIQKIQEEKLSSSRPDSGLGGLVAEYMKYNADSDSGSQKALIADLQLKLAMKDTELHKLQVQVTSNALNQQKMRSEFNCEGSALHDLRAELCSVVEKTRIGDKKQIQLEQQITKLEEELSGKKCQIIELNERISDKVTLGTTLENKLTQRNRKLVEMQKEVESITEKCGKLQEENFKLNTQANENSRLILEKESKLKELNHMLRNAQKNAAHYEGMVKSHEQETQETDSQFESVKKLHAEHCKEYEFQIENLQQQVENKSSHIVTLETKLRSLLQEGKEKETSVSELKEYVQKMEQLLEEKKGIIEKYQKNLETMQEHSKTKCQHVADLQESIEQYKNDLNKVVKQHQDSNAEYENMLQAKSTQLNSLLVTEKLLRDEMITKEDHIRKLESLQNQNMEMLEQSEKRISELEDSQLNYEGEVSALKQTCERERAKSLEEATILTNKLQEEKKQLAKSKNQLTKMSDELNKACSNHLLTQAKMKEQEMNLLSQTELIRKKTEEMEKINATSAQIELYLVEKDDEIKRLEMEITCKDEEIVKSVKTQKELAHRLDTAQTQLHDCLQKLADLEKEFKEREKMKKDESHRKLERMLAISEEDLSMKERELSDYKAKCDDIERVMSEQQWQLKHKAAEFAQLEIAFKNDKSEFEKKITMLGDDINGLKASIAQKDAEFLDLTKSCESLCIREKEKSDTIDLYEKKFNLLEDENMKMIEEVKELSKELQKVKGEVKNTINLEEELSNLRNLNKSMTADMNTLESQLIASQKTVLEMTQELHDAHALVQLKETDCNRLARELGASQVREAQGKARLNQDLRKVVIEEGMKTSQKNDEIELLRNKINELSSSSQQEILSLKHSLQRSEDEKILYKHDLERYNMWIKELEQNGKSLSEQLQQEKKKSKSLNENIILNEAKAARYSTRMSGYKRAAMTHTQSKLSPRSTLGDLTIEMDSTISTVPRELTTVKDSFDNLLKQTVAELDNDNSFRNDTLNGDVNSLTSSPDNFSGTRAFNISSFEST